MTLHFALSTLGVLCGLFVVLATILRFTNFGRARAHPEPLTRAERAIGIVRFTPSFKYWYYRNPERIIRRAIGWLTGRQWKLWYRTPGSLFRRFQAAR